MVFGDNVRARRAARALPRTPTQRGRGRGRGTKAHTPAALLPITNHHRYSTMTQPCHKDTALNQQCCDSKHKGRRGTGQCKRDKSNLKGRTQSEHGDNTGTTHNQHTPPFNKATGQTTRGTPTHRQGTPTFDGEASNTAALQSPCHPTIHYATPPSMMAPPSTTTRGERTEDTPPHEHHRHTLTTRTPHTQQGTVHDMTAVLASTAVG